MLFWSVRDHHECGKYFNTNLSNPRRRFKLTTTRGKIELPLSWTNMSFNIHLRTHNSRGIWGDSISLVIVIKIQ